MEIETSRFGTIEVQEDEVIVFPRGIPGFSMNKRFFLIPHREGSPFIWLQCVDDPDLAFVTVEPLMACRDYSFVLPDGVQEELRIAHEDQLMVLGIVTIPRDDPDAMTVNLLGPIVINTDERIACQHILDPAVYPVRHPLGMAWKRESAR